MFGDSGHDMDDKVVIRKAVTGRGIVDKGEVRDANA